MLTPAAAEPAGAGIEVAVAGSQESSFRNLKDIAAAAHFLLSDDAHFVRTQTMDADGGRGM